MAWREGSWMGPSPLVDRRRGLGRLWATERDVAANRPWKGAQACFYRQFWACANLTGRTPTSFLASYGRFSRPYGRFSRPYGRFSPFTVASPLLKRPKFLSNGYLVCGGPFRGPFRRYGLGQEPAKRIRQIQGKSELEKAGMSETNDRERNALFVRLFLEHERQVFSFILTLVPRWNDADDLLQETSSTLWEKFDEFKEGTSFLAWAITVARYKVLNYRKKERRRLARFGDSLFETLAADLDPAPGTESDARLDALQACIRRLDPKDREIVGLRYQSGGTTAGVAEGVGRSVNAVYKVLNRIHRQLLFCVRENLSQELQKS